MACRVNGVGLLAVSIRRVEVVGERYSSPMF